MAEHQLIGRSTGWLPFDSAAWRAERLLDSSGLTDPAFRSDGAQLPPTYPLAVRVNTEELGIPDAPGRLNGGNWIRWLGPARLADRLERRTTITGVDSKDARTGRLLLYTLTSEFRRSADQRPVATARHVTIRRYPHETPRPPTPSTGAPEPEEMPMLLEVTPRSRDLVRYAAATDDYYEAHYDEPFARASGLPGVIVHGLLKLAWFARAALDWAGPGAQVRELSGSYRGIDLVGEPFRIHGQPEPGANGAGVRLRLAGRSASGALTTTGRAVVSGGTREL